MTTRQPRFTQTLDKSRPHTLLTQNVRTSGLLEYRYDDTGVVVSVPNCHYNQPYWVRVDYLRNWLAGKAQQQAETLRRNPPFGMSKERGHALAAQHQAYARKIREEADRMEKMGNPAFPTVASDMPLSFGVPPGLS